jgi:hypothetical protein
MYDIRITSIGPIVTEPAADTQPHSISIEVLTSDGQKALEMPMTLALELAAAITKHLRQEQILSAKEPTSPSTRE